MVYHCILCKQGVKKGDQGVMTLDPCALVLIPNFNRADEDQEQQMFYCHFECFRRIINDDKILYTFDQEHTAKPDSPTEVSPFLLNPADNARSDDAADQPIQDALDHLSADISVEDEAMVQEGLDQLVKAVEKFGMTAGVWEKLLTHPRGRWVELASLIPVEDPLYRWIEVLDPFMQPREDILIAWVDDYYNRSRPFENNRLVLLALDSGYEWMRKLIIPLERPDRPDPRCIP